MQKNGNEADTNPDKDKDKEEDKRNIMKHI